MTTPGEVRLPDWATTVPQDEEPRPGKRSRVALACQRCKVRKQKCNGANPCSKCQSLDVPCEYVIPQKPMPFGKNQYIKSLERRVAELETLLAKQGMVDLSQDHWTAIRADQSPQNVADDAADSSAHTPDTDDNYQELDWQDGVDNVVSVLRSLSMDANGTGYIGGSSHVTMGKLFSFLSRQQEKSKVQSSRRGSGFLRSLDPSDAESDIEPIDFADVPSDTADRLLTGYFKHIATRFPVVYSVWIRKVHQRRHTLTDVFERTLLHLVYASAGRFLETAGEFGPFLPKRHYAAALSNLGVILDYDDIRSVSALMLMAVYCLRNPVGPGAWTYSRLAMQVALNIGLHRKTSSMRRSGIENEMRKRIFWATYAFDRQISIPLGRPFAISDRDIDVPLPMDIDEATSMDAIARMGEPPAKDVVPERSTSLSSFLQVVRIRRIESDIQQTIYRVDQTPEISDAKVDEFLERLSRWKDRIPLDASKKRDMEAVPYDGYDYYLVFYYKCQRLLLYPQVSKAPVNPRFLKECATACAGVCGAYKRLHQAMSVGYSIMALQTVFMAGLTLVYCIWISPEEIFDITTSNGIHDCSIVLFVIAERVRAAKKYRNAFEVIRQRVIDQVSDGSCRQPRRTMSGLAAELGPSVDSWEVNQPFEVDHDSFEQFSQIITEMSGGMTNLAGAEESSSSVLGAATAMHFTGAGLPSAAGVVGTSMGGDNIDVGGGNAGGFGIDMPTVMASTSYTPEGSTEIAPGDLGAAANGSQGFGADLSGFEGADGLDPVYGDNLSPWFTTATAAEPASPSHAN
ncbi:fungal-specific transcription factor domain-containing protein [Xylariales sp. PMI_506]|nr:fungal-specific transcription factor domain-containing protein [Xylariales sp. PMI_506]